MSEFDVGGRVWRFYIDDMIRFAERIQTYTEGLEQRDFVNDGLTHDATLRNLELRACLVKKDIGCKSGRIGAFCRKSSAKS
uniref:Uncharacterized protein n=1 Tax=Candidatus Kentrum sp. SD TaxID=2126332 RepID=A0A451BRP1_9GAMM|nr:MAG: hypothetical protein BECKSD772F_GA0070984_106222 [Candidatus Kentron sp. SD]VFK46076.1 MAG: hypothetical protein BECKSD772E_GA0070983_106621 [Candidatus Kentron sp. SD]VFK80973.1 MAG: hypothetical protein BECKSD772D_GA0070982_11884 [Candidatus Kentron sp. SD]